jgi:hypothetical protein
MNPDELFKIQSQQMLKEVEKIQWIAKNSQRLIQELFTGVQQANNEFTAENKDPSRIFRGDDFRMLINNIISRESTKDLNSGR